MLYKLQAKFSNWL